MASNLFQMSISSSSDKFFGMDLAVWKAAFAKPWANVYQWPILRWLDPDLPVRLWKEDGTQEIWMAGQTFRPGVGSSRFDAVELPTDLFLVRQLVLPAMPPEQLGQAIALDVKTLSPFPAQDLLWGYTSSVREGGSILAHMVLASRQQVDAYLLARRVQLGLNAHEVWAMAAPGKPVVLPGWNESLRQQDRVKRRRAGYGLLGLACILVMAAVVTPVAQSRLRAIEAAIALSDLQGRAGTLLAQREVMQQAVDRIGQIKAELERVDSDFDREKLQERLAKLSGGVAVVKVGAATETEMKEKKHRVEDALQATRAALEGKASQGATAN